MGTHALNPELLGAQFPEGTMDPENPPVLLLNENDEVMGVEWEAADVGQGPTEMFGQTIEIQPGHPGAEEPHYMLHVYFKPGGKVLFGTNPDTAFDPEGVCPEMPASASASVSASVSASASATARASSGARRDGRRFPFNAAGSAGLAGGRGPPGIQNHTSQLTNTACLSRGSQSPPSLCPYPPECVAGGLSRKFT
jgi:hypothetical protein